MGEKCRSCLLTTPKKTPGCVACSFLRRSKRVVERNGSISGPLVGQFVVVVAGQRTARARGRQEIPLQDVLLHRVRLHRPTRQVHLPHPFFLPPPLPLDVTMSEYGMAALRGRDSRLLDYCRLMCICIGNRERRLRCVTNLPKYLCEFA